MIQGKAIATPAPCHLWPAELAGGAGCRAFSASIPGEVLGNKRLIVFGQEIVTMVRECHFAFVSSKLAAHEILLITF